MFALDMTHDEANLLGDVLSVAVHNLRIEVVHTDRREYREMLKERLAMLESLEKKVRSGARTEEGAVA